MQDTLGPRFVKCQHHGQPRASGTSTRLFRLGAPPFSLGGCWTPFVVSGYVERTWFP
jgi:hypothetical protein